MRFVFALVFASLLLTNCGDKKPTGQKPIQDSSFAEKGSFAYDLAFLQKYKKVIVLGEASSPAKVLLINDYQARVMTSTARGDQGNSFGWINYGLIETGQPLRHFNPVGGEDRIWIGPEGGQFSVFFKKGDAFTFDNWQTPPLIDTDTFELIAVSATQASFRKKAELTNYSGFTFHFDIQRQINLLNDANIRDIFRISTDNLSSVAFQSANAITNTGSEKWEKKKGLLSIWVLGMFTPSDKTVIILPHEKSAPADKKITDDYFGKIPGDRLVKTNEVLMMKGDGKFRGKVGISPAVAPEMIGSYNAEKHILTLVKFAVEKTGDYVNSKWETQREPFKGDAVNAYNDGPMADGTQLGPFFELESSSPARELKPNETIIHKHITLHLEGDEKLLDEIARQKLGMSLTDITNAFDTHGK